MTFFCARRYFTLQELKESLFTHEQTINNEQFYFCH